MDVVQVMLKFFGPGQVVLAGDLGEAGDAGPDFMPFVLLRRKQGLVFQRQRARTDDGHLAFQHIPELRQLIEVCYSKEVAPGKSAS